MVLVGVFDCTFAVRCILGVLSASIHEGSRVSASVYVALLPK